MKLSKESIVSVILIGILSNAGARGEDATSHSSSPKSRPVRREFAEKLALVRDNDKQEEVRRLLGSPEDIRRGPDFGLFPTDEIWGYGADGHGSLATLGGVWFRQQRVFWVVGGRGEPPLPSVVSENELCAGMRFMHLGPEHAGYNDPLHLIRVANYLQPLGKEKALAIIDEYCRIHEPGLDETWLFLVLRTLFEVPQPPGYMPPMGIGAMTPAPPKDRVHIPRFPIVIIDDVPFSLLRHVMLAGVPEPATRHVEYFRKHGTIRAGKLRPPDDPYPSFQNLLKSKEWAKIAKADGDPLWISAYAEHTFLQVLALGRTAYDPPEARQPFADPSITDYERHHRSFLETGARWDEKLQMYVRRDGTHGQVGHLANIYSQEGAAHNEPLQSPAARDHLR
jgi:hypothetical protein